jgi:hypothetical protein
LFQFKLKEEIYRATLMIQINNRAGYFPGMFLKLVSLACLAVPLLMFIFDVHTVLANSGFSAAKHSVSEFALLNYGVLEKASLLLAGLLMVSLSYAWNVHLSALLGKLFKLGSVMLLVVGMCFLLVVIFPTDTHGAARTPTGLVHIGAAALASGIFPVFLLTSYWGIRNIERLKGIAGLTLFTGISGSFCLVWMIAAYIVAGAPGLAERCMMFLYLLWLVIAGSRLAGYAAEV